MMSRIDDAFKHKPIFMPYFPLGYPDLATSIDVIEALAKNGADLIEVGLSFSDPLADGPVIQKATQIALEKGITVKRSLKAIAELRRRGVNIPLVLMSYYNPLLAYGLEKLVVRTASSPLRFSATNPCSVLWVMRAPRMWTDLSFPICRRKRILNS